jgi:ribosomal protein L29
MADAKKKVNVLADFRSMSDTDLVTNIADLRKELVEQHRANKAGELPSAAAIAKTRKSIAKAMTVLTEKSQEVQSEAPKEQEK